MTKTIKRRFKCTGCGIDRPCFLETNQEPSLSDYMVVDDLKCVLDETNQTSYNWEEIYDTIEAYKRSEQPEIYLNELKRSIFKIANELALLGKGGEAVRMHGIHNNL